VHHVILRGLARGQIVADAQDRAACVARVGDRAAATADLLVAALRAIRPESRFEFIQV
jgi:hypothetical protein